MYKPDGHNIAKHNIFITFLQHNIEPYIIADVMRFLSHNVIIITSIDNYRMYVIT